MIDMNSKKKYAMALGYFDGLHTAHTAVLQETLKLSEYGLLPAVMLFDEHPKKVLSGESVPFLLQKSRRDAIIDSMGIKRLCVSFEKIKDMSPREFVEMLTKENVGAAVCGYNYRFGKSASGDVDTLRRLCGEYGIEVRVCEKYLSEGEEVSSTVIRNAVAHGDMEKAERMLGFPFGFSAEVFSGDKRGRLLGAPTINQYLPEGIVIPRFGVYAAKVFFEGREYIGVTNVGSRPTFDGRSVRSETYIIDYSGDLYGKTVETQLFSFIREEKKFGSADALKEQIALDVKSTQTFFEKSKK